MYRMNNLVEIFLGVLLILLVVGQPKRLRHLTHSKVGKLLFIIATIGAGYISLHAGILVAIIYIVLNKDFMLTEGMENKGDGDDSAAHDADAHDADAHDADADADDADAHNIKDNNTSDFVKKYCKNGKVDESLNPPKLKFKKEKCNPCDEGCEFEITSAKEQITVDEALRPKDSKSIPV